MADIKRKQTTTTETTKESQIKYVGQSKTTVTPPVAPVAPKTDVTKPTPATSTNQPTPDIAKPAVLPTQTQSDNSPDSAPQNQPTQSGQPGQPDQSANTPTTSPQAPTTPSSPVSPSSPTSPGAPSEEQPPEEQQEQQQQEQEQKKEKDEDKDKDKDKEKDKETEKEKPKEGETEGEKAPKTKEPTPAEGKSDVSPSLEKDFQNKPKVDLAAKDAAKNKAGSAVAKEGIKDGAEAVGKKAIATGAKQGAKVAIKAAAKAIGTALKAALSTALEALIAAVGWPFLLGCAAIFLILILIFAGLACTAAGGNFGKTNPLPSGKDDPNIKVLITKSTTPSKSVSDAVIKGQMVLNLTDKDKKFLEDGKADKRLLALLNYLSDKQPQLTISSIISGFENPDSKDPENIDEGTSNRTSAHAEGMAADIQTVGFVYKIDRPSESCQRTVASFCGPPGTPSYDFCFGIAKMLKIGNLAYYSDENSSDDATATDTDTSLDSALDQAKFDAEKTILQNVQLSINETQGQYADFAGKLTQSNDILVNFRNQNFSKLNSDQRNKLNTQIDKVQTAINQVNDISKQINDYKDDVNDYQTKIDKLQNKLKTVKSTLVKVQKFNNSLGKNKDADLDKTINNIAKIANQVVNNLNTVDSQLSTINTVLTNTTNTIDSQVQATQSVIGQNQGDMNSYLNNLDSLSITIDAGNVPILFSVFKNGKLSLDGFIQKIEQLATSFIDKTVEQIVDEIKTSIKNQVQEVIDDQVNQVLSGLGLSGFDKNTLLLLPCVGYVVPGTADLTSAIGVDGAISDFSNSKLVSNINSGIDSAVGTVNTANDQLAQVSQSISDVQETITSFTNQVTQLENAADQFAENAGDTYLVQVNQTVTKVQSTSNQEMDSLLKVPAQSQTGDQVCKNDSSVKDPNCTANIQDQQESQQQTETQNQTNNQQNKDNLAKVKTRLQTVKTTLQKTLDKQGNKLSQSQQAKVQEQIQAINKTISQVDIWVTKIDAYKTQMDEVNSKISNAQKMLSSVSNTLLGAQKFVNDISGSIGGWITKLIPSGFRAYGVLPNTTYKDQPYTEAVQIQVKWQDDPPDSKYINGEADNEGILNSLIFYTVYRPEAQRKVHDLIAELLQFPYDMKNKTEYRVTQLITFSKDRDVTPFKALVDKLYGASRPANYGLFSMPEAWAQVHIAY